MTNNSFTYLPAGIAGAMRGDATRQTLGHARNRGFTIPDEIARAESVVAALREIADSTDPVEVSSPPDTPAGVQKAINKIATDRAQKEQARQLAREWLPEAQDRVEGCINRSVVGWVDALADLFDESLDAFRESAALAPNVDATQLSSLHPEAFAAWQKTATAANALDSLLADRHVYAGALRENYKNQSLADLALVAVITPPVWHGDNVAALRVDAEARYALLREAMTGTPTALMTTGAGYAALTGPARWRALLDAESRGWLRLSLARADETSLRLELVEMTARLPGLLNGPDNDLRGTIQTILDGAWGTHATLLAQPVPA